MVTRGRSLPDGRLHRVAPPLTEPFRDRPQRQSTSTGRNTPTGGPIGVRPIAGHRRRLPPRTSPVVLTERLCSTEIASGPTLSSRNPVMGMPSRRTGGRSVAPRSGHYRVFFAAFHAYAALLYFAGAATVGNPQRGLKDGQAGEREIGDEADTGDDKCFRGATSETVGRCVGVPLASHSATVAHRKAWVCGGRVWCLAGTR